MITIKQHLEGFEEVLFRLKTERQRAVKELGEADMGIIKVKEIIKKLKKGKIPWELKE